MAERAAKTPSECVYLIGSADSRLVKIGRTADMVGRLAAIQRMSPAKLMILWQIEAGPWLETALHRKFKEFRAHGEWFDFPDRDALERVQCAIPEVVAKVEEAQRAQEERRARRRSARRAKKARKVWTRPSRLGINRRRAWDASRRAKQPASLAGFREGDVVRIARDGWRYTATGVIHSISPGTGEPFAVRENDGRKHYYLGLFKEAEIAHQRDVAELPVVEPCRLAGCNCANVV